jgi:hypothetical protein
MSQTYVDKNGVEHPDRRHQSHLRTHFDGIRAILQPFMQVGSSWGDAELSYLAKRQVQESYPQLDAMEVHILINAVMRVMREEA